MKVVIYNRVSTSKQSVDSQITELNNYCDSKGWEIVGSFSEVISGGTKNEERVELMKMLKFLKINLDVRKCIVWELSRVGRDVFQIHRIINDLKEIGSGVSLHIKQFGIDTLNIDGTTDLMGGMFISILSEISSMERHQIKLRLQRGKENFLRKGGKLGRKKGSVKSTEQLLEEHSDIVKYLNKGFSIREVVKLTEKNNGTIQKIKKLMKEDEEKEKDVNENLFVPKSERERLIKTTLYGSDEDYKFYEKYRHFIPQIKNYREEGKPMGGMNRKQMGELMGLSNVDVKRFITMNVLLRKE